VSVSSVVALLVDVLPVVVAITGSFSVGFSVQHLVINTCLRDLPSIQGSIGPTIRIA